jgi:hypothetical protein
MTVCVRRKDRDSKPNRESMRDFGRKDFGRKTVERPSNDSQDGPPAIRIRCRECEGSRGSVGRSVEIPRNPKPHTELAVQAAQSLWSVKIRTAQRSRRAPQILCPQILGRRKIRRARRRVAQGPAWQARSERLRRGTS